MKRVLALVLLLCSCGGRIDYPSLGIHEPVVVGGQVELDQGHVVEVDLPGIWIVGHHTRAGGVFANLPNARVGDRVCVYDVCYHVVGFTTLPMDILIPLPQLTPLVLQTSVDGRAFLVLAEPDV